MSPPPAPPLVGPSELFSLLVRDPERLVDHTEDDLARLAPPLLLLLTGATIAFGFTVGVHHSLLQGIYAGVKMPFVFLAPALLAAPGVAAVARALGLGLPPARGAAAGLVAMARIAVFALAFAPILWLAARVVDEYRFTALGTTAILSLAGLGGLRVLARAPLDLAGPVDRSARLGALAAAALLFGAVTAQTGWLLRPFILRPTYVAGLLQAPESDVFTEIGERVAGPHPHEGR